MKTFIFNANLTLDQEKNISLRRHRVSFSKPNSIISYLWIPCHSTSSLSINMKLSGINDSDFSALFEKFKAFHTWKS